MQKEGGGPAANASAKKAPMNKTYTYAGEAQPPTFNTQKQTHTQIQ